jgi:hypothetical protein
MKIKTSKQIIDSLLENRKHFIIRENIKWVCLDDVLEQLRTPKRTKKRIIEMLKGD